MSAPTKTPPPFLRSQGAELTAGGVRYRIWSEHDRGEVLIVDQAGSVRRTLPLIAEDVGYFSAHDPAGRAGDLYQYRFGKNSAWPDPASRWQPEGVHGPSMVIDPAAFIWHDQQWQAPPFSRLVIYELHVGTFTAAGTFRGALDRLDHLVSLGVNALELMPVADFEGDRNWGYDGVMLYAPARTYGHPEDLRALVDAAHARGLAVILDVVYNHFGPSGNYTGAFHRDYANPEQHTPWGAALHYAAAPVRAFFLENTAYWQREFHIDGFRLDATHEIADTAQPHLLAEIAESVHSLGGFVMAEDERNDPSLLLPSARGGYGLDGVWADDFHHVVHVLTTGERDGYYENFEGTARELADTLTHGWFYCGQVQPGSGQPRGGDSLDLPAACFVYCISNHDQVGNRAHGERLGHLIPPAVYRALSALLCLVPETPLIFQGQEWSASTPFQFFTDHNPELGPLVTAGRRREFQDFPAFRDPAQREKIPDPQAASTFADSKLRWDELETPEHAATLQLYRAFLELRKTHPAWRDRSPARVPTVELPGGLIAFRIGPAGNECLVVSDLRGGHVQPDFASSLLAPPAGRTWRSLLSSNDSRCGGDGAEPFSTPTTLVLTAE
ncbi:MAG: malto-oligosyltrehalose trehalohydrolase [Chthoniobacterales bacterium]